MTKYRAVLITPDEKQAVIDTDDYVLMGDLINAICARSESINIHVFEKRNRSYVPMGEEDDGQV